jgi:hypothetical protein
VLYMRFIFFMLWYCVVSSIGGCLLCILMCTRYSEEACAKNLSIHRYIRVQILSVNSYLRVLH